MISIPPTALILFGLVMDFTGAVLLGLEALGARDFLSAYKQEKTTGLQMTKIGFIAAVNRTSIFILVWVISFCLLELVSAWTDLALNLLISPFVYFAWRLVVRLSAAINRLWLSLRPGRVRPTADIWASTLDVISRMAWGVMYVAISCVAMAVEFGIDLPLRYFAEKVIARAVLRAYRLLETVQTGSQRWHFNRMTFVGILLLLGGFLYQIIGVLMILLTENDRYLT